MLLSEQREARAAESDTTMIINDNDGLDVPLDWQGRSSDDAESLPGGADRLSVHSTPTERSVTPVSIISVAGHILTASEQSVMSGESRSTISLIDAAERHQQAVRQQLADERVHLEALDRAREREHQRSRESGAGDAL